MPIIKEMHMTPSRTHMFRLAMLVLLASALGASLVPLDRASLLLAEGEEKADLPTGVEWRFRAHTRAVSALAVSPDGSLLATGGLDGKATLWDMTGKVPVEKLALCAAKLYIADIRFSPDGKYVAVLPAASPVVSLRRLGMDAAAEITMPVRHTDRIWSMAFSPDSKKIATAGTQDLTVRIWKISAMSEKEASLGAHKDSVEYVGYSPDGKRIASSGEDAMIYVWNLEADSVKGPLGIAVENELGAVRSLQFSADGQYIVSGTPASHKTARYSAEDLQLTCWNAISGKVVKTITYRGTDARLNAWSISSDMDKIVLADDRGRVSLYRGGHSAVSAQWDVGVSIRQVALVADGEAVVTGDQDGTVCLIKLPREK